MAAELETGGVVLSLDVRSEEAVAAAVNKVVERFGHIHILVNNAGLCQWNGRVTDMPRAAQSERRAPTRWSSDRR